MDVKYERDGEMVDSKLLLSGHGVTLDTLITPMKS